MTKTQIESNTDFAKQMLKSLAEIKFCESVHESYKMAHRLQPTTTTRVISLHLSASEINSIDRILQYQAISRSELIQRKIKQFHIQLLFTYAQEKLIISFIDSLVTAASKNDIESALESARLLTALNNELNISLKLHTTSDHPPKFISRNRDGLKRTTSVRISSDAAERLKKICWISGLTITDVIMRLVMQRQIPDKQIIKLKLLLKSAGLKLQKVDSEDPMIKAAIDDCRNSIQNICEVIRNDF